MRQKSGRKAAAAASEETKTRDPESSSEPTGSDTVLIRGVSEDGQGLSVLRAREDRVEAGVVRPLRDGEAVMGELVRLKPRPDFPLVCDVEVELPSRIPAGPQPARLNHGGPAQVATESYRANWDAIWSKPKTDERPN
ncbi:MAG: hypothetical protein ABW252_02205 [Polyangiales bacterium]